MFYNGQCPFGGACWQRVYSHASAATVGEPVSNGDLHGLAWLVVLSPLSSCSNITVVLEGLGTHGLPHLTLDVLEW